MVTVRERPVEVVRSVACIISLPERVPLLGGIIILLGLRSLMKGGPSTGQMACQAHNISSEERSTTVTRGVQGESSESFMLRHEEALLPSQADCICYMRGGARGRQAQSSVVTLQEAAIQWSYATT